MKLRTPVLFLLLLQFTCVAFAGDFNGKWTTTLPHAALGDIHFTYTFKVDGDKVTGTAVTQFFTATLKDMKIDGDTISFVEPVEFAGMVFDVNVKGKIGSDTIKFTRQFKEEPPQDYEAKRAAPAASDTKQDSVSGFNGKWTATLPHAALGDIHFTYTFKVDGDKVTGTAVTQFFTSTLKDMKIDGDTISFVEPVEISGMSWDFNVKGKINGDTIKFTRQYKEESPQDYEAKRAAAAASDTKQESVSGLNGNWTSTVKHPALGDLNYVYTFKVDGER